MIRCSECKKEAVKATKYMDWLALINFMEFLYNEEYIELKTFEAMYDRLQTMKDFAFEDEND